MASVMELDGKATDPETFKLVEVMEVAIKLVRFKLVAAKVSKKPFVLVTDVPVAVVNPNAPESVPPVRSK